MKYLDRVALITFVIGVDETAFDLVDYLPKDIRNHPKPNIRQRVLHFIADLVFLELSAFLPLVEICQHHKDQSKRYHDSVNDELRDF